MSLTTLADYVDLKDLTPITMSYVDLYNKTKDIGFLQNLRPMDPEQTWNTDKSKLYKLHQDYDHTLEDCSSLKIPVEIEICKGNLNDYIKGKLKISSMITCHINHINDTFFKERAISNSEQKPVERQKAKCYKHYQSCIRVRLEEGLNNKTWEDSLLAWMDKRPGRLYVPHYDPVMILVQIGLCRVARIPVDERSDSSILLSNYLKRMGLPSDIVTSDTGYVYGFDYSEFNLVSRI